MVSAISDRSNQWGRKDPFTPRAVSGEVQIYNANGNTIQKGDYGMATTDKQSEFKFEDKVTTTINNLIQNPSTHYTKGDGTNQVPIASTEGYNNTTKEGDWWNPTIKTIYDPCPNGYRIPESGTYGNKEDWTISDPYSVLTAGYTWNNNDISFFPASGYRNAASGILTSVGGYSAKWMSTPYYSIYSFQLRLYGNNIIPNIYIERSFGFPTRCIKE